MKFTKIFLPILIFFALGIPLVHATVITGSANVTITSGTINSATNCSIPYGASTCNTSVNWNVINGNSSNSYLYEQYTTGTFNNALDPLIAPGTSGTVSYPIRYGTNNFYLKDNAQYISGTIRPATASCGSQLSWNGSKCVTTRYTLYVNTEGNGNGQAFDTMHDYGSNAWAAAYPDADSTLTYPDGPDCDSDGYAYMDSDKLCYANFTLRSNITQLSVSQNPVPAGSSNNVTYSCSNGMYSHLLLDWTWGSSGGWDYSGYYSSGVFTIPAAKLTQPGPHTISAYCYNNDWIPSYNSWTSVTFNVNGIPAPNLKVSTDYVTNSDGPTQTYAAGPVNLSWAAVPNATSCILSGGTLSPGAVTTGVGSKATNASSLSQTYTLTCSNSTGQTASDTVIVTVPPPPTNVGYTCSADSMTANVHWTAPSGYTNFYLRTQVYGSNYGPGWSDNYAGTSIAIPIEPNVDYTYWMHTRNASGAYSAAPYLNINCERIHYLGVDIDTSDYNGSGTVSGDGYYYYGENAQVTATADTGSSFVVWEGDCSDTDNYAYPTTYIDMYSDHQCTAAFANDYPTQGPATITPSSINNDNSSQYTISMSASDTGGAGNIYNEYALINYQGGNAGAYRGYITWGAGDWWPGYQDHQICSGSGGSAVIQGGYGSEYIHLVSCNTVDSGNKRTINFVVKFNPAFSAPTANNDISTYVCDNMGQCAGWYNNDINFSLNPMTGFLGSSVNSCLISAGANSCTTNLTWGTTNPQGTSAITATGMTNFNGNSGTMVSFAVPYASRLFHLYNNSVELASKNVTSSCISGTTWNGTNCTLPSGLISASACNIPLNASSCLTTLTWTTNLPVGVSSVTTPTSITVATGNSDTNLLSGSKTYPMTPAGASRVFYLYNNGVLKSQATAPAPSCIAGSWNGSICAQNNLTIVSPGAISGTYGAPGVYAVNYGASPVITAQAWSGYSVTISGGCTATGGVGLGASCTVNNMVSAQTVTVTYGDPNPPTAPGIMTTTWVRDHYINTNFVAATTGSTDVGSGIRGYRLCRSLDNAGGCSVWTTNGEHAALSETVSGSDLPSDGTFRYYYWYAFDNSGNQSTNSVGEYIRMDATNPVYNSTTFTGCGYASGNNCYVKNGTTFYINVSHTDTGSGSNNQYLELSKDGANRGSWDGATGNIKSYAVPYGVSNGGNYTSYGEGLVDNASFDIQNPQCIQSGDCNVTALGKWPVIAGSGPSNMYGVTVYMYDGLYNGVGYTDTGKYVYLDNTAPNVPTPTDAGAYSASTSLTFTGTANDSSSGISSCTAQIDVNNTDGLSLAMDSTLVNTNGSYTWTGGVAGNTYYYRYVCTDNVGNTSGWSNWSDGISVNTIPTVASPGVTSVTSTSAILRATVASLGIPAAISARGTCWGTSANPTTNCLAEGGTTSGIFTQTRTGFTPGTTYYYRGYATNATGTGYSTNGSFTTAVNLTIVSPGNVLAPAYFAAPVNTTYAVAYNGIPTVTAEGWAGYYASISGACNIGPGSIGANVSCTVPNMTSAKTVTVTYSTIPTVTTSSPISLGQYSGAGGGTIVSNGGSAVSLSGIVWSTSVNPTIADSKTTDGWASGGPWTSNMTGLTLNTTYHVRAYATNAFGTAYGSDLTFTTNPALIPTVTTSSPISLGQYSGAGGGTIVSDGGATITVSGIVWSTSVNPTTASNLGITYDGWATGGPWTSNMTGLTINTTYNVRAYATNSAGTSYGSNQIFTTSPAVLPTVITTDPVPTATIKTNTAIGGGTTSANGGATVTQAGLVWGSTANPTIARSLGITYDGWAIGGPWASSITGLTYDTIYHVRAYAINVAGTSYGADVTFRTQPVLSTANIHAIDCRISSGSNVCNTTLNWDTINPISGFTSVISLSGVTVTTGNSMAVTPGYSKSIYYGNNVFSISHAGKTLSSVTASAICSQIPTATYWDGSICHSTAVSCLENQIISTGGTCQACSGTDIANRNTNTCEPASTCVSPKIRVPFDNSCQDKYLCVSPQVYVAYYNTCQDKVVCTDPQIRDIYTNTCIDPANCKSPKKIINKTCSSNSAFIYTEN